MKQGVKRKAFGEGKFVFVGDFLGFFVGDNLRFVVILEEVFEFLLVENDNRITNDGYLVVIGHLEGNFGRERFETFTVELPRRAAFECGTGGDAFGDVESFLAVAVGTGVGETGDDTFDFFEFIGVVEEGIDFFVFVFDEMNESLSAANIAEFGAVNNFFFAVSFFVFAAFEAFVGFFDNISSSLLHEKGFNTGGELIRIANFVRSIIFVEEEKFNRDVVFYFVDFVSPVEDVESVRSVTVRRCSV